jgi:chromosome segregation ATPase
MNKTEMMADRLREIAREYNFAFRTLNQAADMIENQARHIEALQAALETERHNHDRLQDWDRGMTEQLEQAQKRIAELEGKYA